MTSSTLVRPHCKRCQGRVSFEYDLEYHILIGSCVCCGNQTYPDSKPEPKPPMKLYSKKFCAHGHRRTKDSTREYKYPNGRTIRICKLCEKDRDWKRREKERKALASLAGNLHEGVKP